MKVIKVKGKPTQGFVLKETDESIVFIPVKYLHRVDYERLKEIETKNPKDMLGELKKTKLSNGINALVQYDKSIIVVPRDEAEGKKKEPVKRGPGRPPKNTKVEPVKEVKQVEDESED